MTAKKTKKTTHAHATVHAEKAATATDDTTTAIPVEIQASAAAAVPSSSAPSGAAPAGAPVLTPLQVKVQELIGTLSAIPVILGSAASPASPLLIADRRAQPKMRTGGDAKMPAILDLADQYKLSVPGASTADARADIQLAATLAPLAATLSAMLTPKHKDAPTILRPAEARTLSKSRATTLSAVPP